MAKDSATEEIDALKKEIHCLLLTYPKGVNAKSFVKTLRDVCGCDLPHNKYGFNSPESMLFSFMDTVRAQRTNEGVVLFAVPSEKSDHVQELVSNQKSTAPKRRYNYKSPRFRGNLNIVYGSRNKFEPMNYPARNPLFPYPFHNLSSSFTWQLGSIRSTLFTSRSCGPQPEYHPPQPPVQSRSPVVPLMWNGHYCYQTQWPIPVTYQATPYHVQKPSRPPPGFFSPPAYSNGPLIGVESKEVRVPDLVPSSVEEASPRSPSPLHEHVESEVITSGESPEEQTTVPEENNPTLNNSGNDDSDEGFMGSSTIGHPRNARQSSECEISDRMIHNFEILLSEHPEGINSSKFPSLYLSKFNAPLHIEDYGFSSVREMVLRLPKVFLFEKTKTAKDWTLFDARISPKKKVVKETWIPVEILNNMSILSQDHADGIKADDVIKMYQDRFKIQLDIKLLGFSCTLAFLNSCRSITVQEMNGSHVVLPKSWALTNNPQESYAPAPALPPDDQLAHLWTSYFKENECGPSFEYTLPTVPNEKLLKVFICEVFYPCLLWIHDVSRKASLNAMMRNLNHYYDENETNLIYPEEMVKVNFPCVVKFPVDDTWYRTKIIKIMNHQQVQVSYVDYGTEGDISVKELRKLVTTFATDPIYAYKCKIAGIEPFDGEWSPESQNFLYSYYETAIYAEFLDTAEPDDGTLSIRLWDTTKSDVDINLGEMLIEKKLAKAIKPLELERFDEDILRAEMTVLPYWMTESDMGEQNDLLFTAQNLIASGDPNFGGKPLDVDVDQCCNEHNLQSFFKSSPEATMMLWRTVLTKYRDQMTTDFLRMAYELSSGIDFKNVQFVHGVRCPARCDRERLARDRMLNSRPVHQVLRDLSLVSTEPCEDLPDENLAGPTPLANSTVLNSRVPSIAYDLRPPISSHDQLPSTTEGRHHLIDDPYGIVGTTSQPHHTESPNKVTHPHLKSVPSGRSSPRMVNHEHYPSSSHASRPISSPGELSIVTSSTHMVPSVNTPPGPSLVAPQSPRLPPVTPINTEFPLPIPSPPVNGYFNHRDDVSLNQRPSETLRQRSDSVSSRISQGRCRCTASVQKVELADQIVHVVQHGDGLYLCCDELLRVYAGHVSKNVIHERFYSGQKYFKFAAVQVNASDHPNLFDELQKYGLVDGQSMIIMFSVREVGHFFRTILPNDTLLADLADEQFRL